MTEVYSSNVDVLAILPPTGDDFDFEAIDCLPTGPEVTIVDDFEITLEAGFPVLEILGDDSKIVFFTNTKLPYVAFHMKTIEKFLSLSLTFVDDIGETRTATFSNKRSVVTADPHSVEIPLKVGEGWQYLTLDLQNTCINAFGTNYASCTEVAVHGSCRLGKLFFQQSKYADVQLPTFLRVCEFTVED
jgi:hypothetical protein